MPTIKIVPMPGVSVPGPQGPRGYQGDQGIPGPQGPAATTGDIEFSGNNITAHGDMTIGVDVVPGVVNVSAYAGVNIQTHQDFGLYVNGIEPDNKVVTVGDMPSLFPQPVDWTPVLSATNFSQTSNPAHGHYMKYGKMVVCHIEVPLTNVTNFGTGIYSLSLPFPVAHHMTIPNGTLHDADTQSFYSLRGHVVNAGDSSMTLWYQSVVTKDAEFDNNSPITLTNQDLIHFDFIYETTA